MDCKGNNLLDYISWMCRISSWPLGYLLTIPPLLNFNYLMVNKSHFKSEISFVLSNFRRFPSQKHLWYYFVVKSAISVLHASVILDEYWFAVRRDDSNIAFIYVSIYHRIGISLEVTESVQYIYACFYVIDTCVFKITYDESNAELVST